MLMDFKIRQLFQLSAGKPSSADAVCIATTAGLNTVNYPGVTMGTFGLEPPR
jgi:hypothetical protein